MLLAGSLEVRRFGPVTEPTDLGPLLHDAMRYLKKMGNLSLSMSSLKTGELEHGDVLTEYVAINKDSLPFCSLHRDALVSQQVSDSIDMPGFSGKLVIS